MRALMALGLILLLVVGGLLSGIAGLLLWPIVGLLAVVAVFLWMGERKAEGKPPME